MDENHLSHSTWDCKYHVVFGSKYRTERLYGELRMELRDQFVKLASQKGCHIEEGHLMPDQVHMLISIPPEIFGGSCRGVFERENGALCCQQICQEAPIQGVSFLGARILCIDDWLQ